MALGPRDVHPKPNLLGAGLLGSSGHLLVRLLGLLSAFSVYADQSGLIHILPDGSYDLSV